MKVEPHDHVLRFRVSSETRGAIEHVVDLGEFDGFGECSCEDYQFRILPIIQAQGTAGLTRCKHLTAARLHLADLVIRRILENVTTQTPT